MMRSLVRLLVMVGATLAATPGRGRAQESAVRFEITDAQDTTFSFPVGRHLWVMPGQRGIVVDPRRRDVLVARFRVVSVENGVASAVVTGQTTAISTAHAALLELPRAAWWKHGTFWAGLLLGAAAGFAGGMVAQR